ncbi:hypothetical protein Tsedi_01301 [Tepidimonas sediminis]|uniref:Toxin CptA n=1 Tax=Tepidimonas sediminis TaxID=2588941 RepID=A0A554WQ86_9BURK|nr:hypothetical protein [Tepidimonas sediminis]TSE25713.1 hypothetical protein Tsedi_01301 [Tepidimonas sediminis]
MRPAAAVRHPARTWRPPLALVLATATVAAAVWGRWAWLRPDLPPAWWAGAVLGLVWLGVALAQARRQGEPGELVWDPASPDGGQGWLWQPVGRARPQALQAPQVAWRGAAGVLVCARRAADGAPLRCWCPAQQGDGPALRRALAATGAPPPSAIVGARRTS